MNSLHKKLLKIPLICFLQLILMSCAMACMCPVNSVGGEFTGSRNVIIAKQESYELDKTNIEGEQSDIESPTDLSSISEKMLPKLKVQKVFKGNFKVGEVLEFDRVYRCNLVFGKVGEEYLLYLGDKPKQGELWQAPPCSKSGLLKNRLADILYISKENKVRNKTRISGRLFYDYDLISKKTKSQLPTLANRKVYIVGTVNQFETKTDENGVYEIYDLPVDSYRIYSENIQGFNNKVSNYDSEIVQITTSGQYERDFKYTKIDSVSKKIFEKNDLYCSQNLRSEKAE